MEEENGRLYIQRQVQSVLLPVQNSLSECQTGNSKCLALKVFPTPTYAATEEIAASKRSW